jgi:crotonobetainyl-CoA:carnitine CoA-transferase CaiB-like acyl-CoA transferase
LLTPLFTKKTAIVWSRVLDDHGVPNEVPLDSKAGEYVLFDADNERLGMVAEYEHPIVGRMRQFGSLIDFSETPGLVHGPPPMVGQHTREILGWLGYDDGAMRQLKDERVVYWPDGDYRWNV